MKIPKKFPQFERFPALFITSGEYEAHFYMALHGEIDKKDGLKMEPRKEAREKQGFIGRKGGMTDLSSFSHHGNYIQDLKMKFAREVHRKMRGLVLEHKLEEIYIFAPKYVTKRILNELNKSEKKKIRMQFYKEYTKQNPLDLIGIFKKKMDEIQELAIKTPGTKDDLVTFHG